MDAEVDGKDAHASRFRGREYGHGDFESAGDGGDGSGSRAGARRIAPADTELTVHVVWRARGVDDFRAGESVFGDYGSRPEISAESGGAIEVVCPFLTGGAGTAGRVGEDDQVGGAAEYQPLRAVAGDNDFL